MFAAIHAKGLAHHGVEKSPTVEEQIVGLWGAQARVRLSRSVGQGLSKIHTYKTFSIDKGERRRRLIRSVAFNCPFG